MSSSSNSNKNENILIYPNMPEESGIAALVHTIAKKSVDVICLNTVDDKMHEKVGDYKNIYILGSYWKKSLTKISENKFVFVFSRESNKYSDPLEFVKTEILKDYLSETLVQSFFRRHKKFLDLTIKKYLGDADAKFNVCFTGLWQIATNMFDAYMKIFSEEETLESCSKKGKHAIVSNKLTAERRVINNSSLIDRGSFKVAITCGPELNADTHEALIKYHRDVDVTEVEYTVHGRNPSTKVSIWSHSDKVDVGEFAKKKGGGGSKNRAGFSVKIEKSIYDSIIPSESKTNKKK